MVIVPDQTTTTLALSTAWNEGTANGTYGKPILELLSNDIGAQFAVKKQRGQEILCVFVTQPSSSS